MSRLYPYHTTYFTIIIVVILPCEKLINNNARIKGMTGYCSDPLSDWKSRRFLPRFQFVPLIF